MTDPVVPPPAPPAAPPPAPPTPAPPAPPAAPPAPTPAAAAPTTPSATTPVRKTLADLVGEKEPDEAQRRLARAARKGLEEFGIKVGKNDDVAKAAEDYKAKREEEKTERKQLKERADQAIAYESQVKTYLAGELPKLSAQEQQLIKARAGDDPLKQMQEFTYLQTLRAGGVIPAPAAPAAPTTPAPPAPLAAPATTAPPSPGPVVTPPGNTDHKAHYKTLVDRANGGDKRAHIEASAYLHTHARDIHPEKFK